MTSSFDNVRSNGGITTDRVIGPDTTGCELLRSGIAIGEAAAIRHAVARCSVDGQMVIGGSLQMGEM